MTSKCFLLVALDFVWIFFNHQIVKQQCLNHVCTSQEISTRFKTLVIWNPTTCTCNFEEHACFRGLVFCFCVCVFRRRKKEKNKKTKKNNPLTFQLRSVVCDLLQWVFLFRFAGEITLNRSNLTVRKKLSASLMFKREGFRSLSFTHQRRHSGRK